MHAYFTYEKADYFKFSTFENIGKSYSKASKGKITSFFLNVIKTYLRAEENFKCSNIDTSDVLTKDDKVITNIHSSKIGVKLFKHYGAMTSQIQKHSQSQTQTLLSQSQITK